MSLWGRVCREDDHELVKLLKREMSVALREEDYKTAGQFSLQEVSGVVSPNLLLLKGRGCPTEGDPNKEKSHRPLNLSSCISVLLHVLESKV